MTTGYIYIIENQVGGLGGFKIGKTINPKRRFQQLKVGTKARLVGFWKSDRYSEIEKELHKIFNHLRIPQSEWFALEKDKLKHLIDRLNRSATCVELCSKYKPVTTNPYVGPSPVWTDYSRPAVLQRQRDTIHSYNRREEGVAEGLLVGFCAPFLSFFLFLIQLFDKQEHNSGYMNALGWSSTIMLVLCLSTAAQAKPLQTYEQPPHINVSYLN